MHKHCTVIISVLHVPWKWNSNRWVSNESVLHGDIELPQQAIFVSSEWIYKSKKNTSNNTKTFVYISVNFSVIYIYIYIYIYNRFRFIFSVFSSSFFLFHFPWQMLVGKCLFLVTQSVCCTLSNQPFSWIGDTLTQWF